MGDDTDGHVDDLTRFVDPRTVVTVVEEDPADENYEPLQENLERLRAMRDQDGRPLRVVTLPMPRPLYHDGQRLPASYANFYIANGLVLLPTYDPDRATPRPRRHSRDCFPAARWSASTAPTWSGAWAPSTASPSSGRRCRRPRGRRTQVFFQVPTRAARRPPQESIPKPAMCSSFSVRLTT